MCCGDCDIVAEPAECLHQHSGTFLLSLRIRFAAFLDKACPLMQDLPNDATEPMGDRPDRGLIAQSRQQTAEERLKITASLLDCRVGCLVQDPSQILVSFGGATTVVLLGTFILAWTGSHPRGQFR